MTRRQNPDPANRPKRGPYSGQYDPVTGEKISGKKPIRQKFLKDIHYQFARRYALNGGNACKAAREIGGVTEFTAHTHWAHDPLILAEVQRIRDERAKKWDLKEERMMKELIHVAFSNISDFVIIKPDGTPVIDCSDVGIEELAAISEITQDIYFERTGPGEEDTTPVKRTKFKFHDKLKALDMLCKIIGLYKGEGGTQALTPEERAKQIRTALEQMNAMDGVSNSGKIEKRAE